GRGGADFGESLPQGIVVFDDGDGAGVCGHGFSAGSSGQRAGEGDMGAAAGGRPDRAISADFAEARDEIAEAVAFRTGDGAEARTGVADVDAQGAAFEGEGEENFAGTGVTEDVV